NTTNTAAFYALFKTAYSSTNTVGYSRLPAGIRYSISSVALGNAIDVVFAQTSGLPSVPTSITLELAPSGKTIATSTIIVNADGLVSF
ncbi:MAG: hypothetical protein Q7R94_01100, partial [bacterium]|nr:hypothetical protein [bacterium]